MAKKCQIEGCEREIKRHPICLKHRDAARHKSTYKLKPKRTCNLCSNKIGHNSKRGLCPRCIRKVDADKDASRARQYYQDNKEKVALYRKNRYNSNIKHRLSIVLRARLNIALKKSLKSGSAVKDLGCSIEYFKEYLESKWQPGMSWGNYGQKVGCWNIDHIVPLDNFNLTNHIELATACHYSNLQPMWAIDNYRKSNKNGT